LKLSTIAPRTRTLIPGFLLLACSLPPCWSADVQPYPPDWPELKAMSADCREVSGTYVDPDAMHWQSVEQHGGVTSSRGGTLEAAWPLFGFLDAARLRLNDATVKSRTFSITFSDDGDLVIDYDVEGSLVATRRFDRGTWTCGANGLQVTTLERKGAISDVAPNDGRSTRTLALHRGEGGLIVKEMNESTIYFLHMIPRHDQAVRWYRFPTSPHPRVQRRAE
jgi:hypothetical protein